MLMGGGGPSEYTDRDREVTREMDQRAQLRSQGLDGMWYDPIDFAGGVLGGLIKKAAVAGGKALVGATVGIFGKLVTKRALPVFLSNAEKSLLVRAAAIPHNKVLTKAGHALTKHPELVGLTKGTLRGVLPTEDSLNRAAQAAVGSILQQGTAITRSVARYGQVIDVAIPGQVGVRFTIRGEFVGFLNP